MKKINVGLIGAGFMSKAHSIAYSGMPIFFHPAPAMPVKVTLVDSNPQAAEAGRERFGFQKWATDWHDIVDDPDIQVVTSARRTMPMQKSPLQPPMPENTFSARNRWPLPANRQKKCIWLPKKPA